MSVIGDRVGAHPADYDTQDGERKAFARLALSLKQAYPRVLRWVVADGRYPTQTFFQIGQDHGGGWIVPLKDGNVPTVWARVLQRQARPHCRYRAETGVIGGQTIQRPYAWHPPMRDQTFTIQGVAWEETVNDTVTRFVYLSSLEIDYYSVLEVTTSGRLRWKIENPGVAIQKHHGYGLGPAYSRRAMPAMKNYYQLRQMAHRINQLFERRALLTDVSDQQERLVHLWQGLLGELRHESLDWRVLTALLARRMRMGFV